MRRLISDMRRWQFGLALVLVTASAWADWPMFRLDPAHTGVVPNASLGQIELAWSRDIGGSVDSSPAVVGGVVFVGNSLGQMRALSADDGSGLWQFQASGAVMSSPAVADGLVVFGSVDRFLYALRADTGELVWRYRTYGPIISSPTCADGVVYFTSMGGRAYAGEAVRARDGRRAAGLGAAVSGPSGRKSGGGHGCGSLRHHEPQRAATA